jgi:hypothetical protein
LKIKADQNVGELQKRNMRCESWVICAPLSNAVTTGFQPSRAMTQICALRHFLAEARSLGKGLISFSSALPNAPSWPC